MGLRTAATPAHAPPGCPHHSRLSLCPFSSSPLLSLWFATHRQRTQREEEPVSVAAPCAEERQAVTQWAEAAALTGRMQGPGPADPPMEPPDLDRDGCCGRVPSWFFSLLPGHQQCCSLFPDRLNGCSQPPYPLPPPDKGEGYG